MIVKYKFFETSDLFESFQNENDINIHGISPMPINMTADAPSQNNEQEFNLNIGVFVTYSDKKEA